MDCYIKALGHLISHIRIMKPSSIQIKKKKSYSDELKKLNSELDSLLAPGNYAMRFYSDDDVPKTELDWKILRLKIDLHKKIYPYFFCRLCYEEFTSEHAYQFHLMKHKPKCRNCKCEFKSWKAYSKHIPYCSKNEWKPYTIIEERVYPEKKQAKFKLRCQLCQKRYKDQKHLRNHQIHRCTKRYLKNGWIVKV